MLVKQHGSASLYAVDSAWDQSPTPLVTYGSVSGFYSCARKFGSDVLISTRSQERQLPLMGSYPRPAALLCLDAETKNTKWTHTEELSSGELGYCRVMCCLYLSGYRSVSALLVCLVGCLLFLILFLLHVWSVCVSTRLCVLYAC